MLIDIARVIVLFFGILIGALCIWGFVAPAKLVAMVKTVVDQPAGLVGAVGVRIVLGAALIIAAPASMFPTVFTVLGWIAIAAAIGLAIIGRKGMQRMVGWVTGWSPVLTRLWLVFGLLFAAFLIHAA